MRVRKLSPTGDYLFGQQQGNFYVDQPEAVAQVVKTRLKLVLGAWYLDVTDGMDWYGKVLGERTAATRDATIRARVLTSPGVTEIDGYNSVFDPNKRAFSVNFGLTTQYGSFGLFAENYIVPLSTPQPQPPAKPVDVQATPVSQTEVQVSWQPYAVPGPTSASLSFDYPENSQYVGQVV